MKQFFLSACSMVLGISLTLFYNHLTAEQNTKSVAPQETDSGCDPNSFYGLTVKEFMEGVARYKTTRADLIDSSLYMDTNNIRDARSCWYSIDTLKKFICLIEKFSAPLGINHHQLGIRFFYAVYAADTSLLLHKRYKGHHTLFMVPTRKEEGRNIDFDPRYLWKKKNLPHGGKLLPGDYIITGIPPTVRPLMLDGVSVNRATGELDENMSKNQGQLCPPFCPDSASNTLRYIDSNYRDIDYN